MLERLILVLVVLAATISLGVMARWLVQRRVATVLGMAAPPRLRGQISGTGATLVYFYGPFCGTCVDQARALDELAAETGTQVLKFDSTQDQELADALGVLTVPTTAVLDRLGRVRHLNLGYHPKATLAAQVAAT